MPECTKCASKTEKVAYLNDEYDRREFEVIQNVLENWTDGRSKRQHLLDCGQGRFFINWLTAENENTPTTHCFKTKILFY